jgi:hypothetical protein
MQKFVIEREVPGVGNMNADELRDLSGGSNKVLSELGPDIQWVQSYVTDDKIYCVYLATGEDIVLEHARCGGFPANKVSVVRTIIDPTTATVSA